MRWTHKYCKNKLNMSLRWLSATVHRTLWMPHTFGQRVPDSWTSNRESQTAVCNELVVWDRDLMACYFIFRQKQSKILTIIHQPTIEWRPCLGDAAARTLTADVIGLSTFDEVFVDSSIVRRKNGCCRAYRGVIRILWSYSNIRSTRSLNLR